MAKGIGLIGNFKGKVGNMVGYHLSDSNTGNTQGIRVYQPIVKNPKTAGQAEQRAKLAPINATYRALKMIIDRGNEGLPYGNKSRLAWLKQAFKAQTMPWFEKGALINSGVVCQLTKGSLAGLSYTVSNGMMNIECANVTSESDIDTIGSFSSILIDGISSLKEGDQITVVRLYSTPTGLNALVDSFILNKTSNDPQDLFEASTGKVTIDDSGSDVLFAVIVSREGANGEHLRSTSSLVIDNDAAAAAPYDATSKAAAIASYQSSASANADWAEESIQ